MRIMMILMFVLCTGCVSVKFQVKIAGIPVEVQLEKGKK